MTHSPAPWKFRGSYLRDANGTELFCEVPNGLPIAQDDANRRLVESAPELYRLAKTLTVMRTLRDGTVNIGPVGWGQLQELLRKLEEAQ